MLVYVLIRIIVLLYQKWFICVLEHEFIGTERC